MATPPQIMETDEERRRRTIGRTAAAINPLVDPVKTVIPGAAGAPRWTVPGGALTSSEVFNQDPQSVDPRTMLPQSSVTLQQGDIDRVQANRAGAAANIVTPDQRVQRVAAAMGAQPGQAGGTAAAAAMGDANGDGIPDGAQVSRVMTRQGPDGQQIRTTAKFTQGQQGEAAAAMGEAGPAAAQGQLPQPQAGAPTGTTAQQIREGNASTRGVTGFNQGIENLLIMRGSTGRDTGARRISENILGAREAVLQQERDTRELALGRAQEAGVEGIKAEGELAKRTPQVIDVNGEKFVAGAPGQTVVAAGGAGGAKGIKIGDTIGGIVVTGFDSKGQPRGSKTPTATPGVKALSANDAKRFTQQREQVLNEIDRLQTELDKGNKQRGPDWLPGTTYETQMQSLNARLSGLDAALAGTAGGETQGQAAQATVTTFATVEEAEAAGLPPGTTVTIGGRRAVIN